MKKRIFSLVLALMLCLSLAPMAALAASDEPTAEPTNEIAEETVAEPTVTPTPEPVEENEAATLALEGSTPDLPNDGGDAGTYLAANSISVCGTYLADKTYYVCDETGTLQSTTEEVSSGYIYYDASTGVLTLNNISLTANGENTAAYGLHVPDGTSGAIELNVTGACSLKATSTGQGIYMDDVDCTVTGTGTLAVTSAQDCAVYVNSLTVNSGVTLNATAEKTDGNSKAISANRDILLKGTVEAETKNSNEAGISSTYGSITIESPANVNASGGWYAVHCNAGALKLKGGKLTAGNAADAAIQAKGVEISGGELNVTGTGTGVYLQSGNVTISGGTVNITSTGGIAIYIAGKDEEAGIPGGEKIIISGGTVTASSFGVALYGNTGVEISGGTVNVTSSAEAGIYSPAEVKISAGTVTSDAYYAALQGNTGVEISGGTVTAISSATGYMGIYSPKAISITGGTVAAAGTYPVYGVGGLSVNGDAVVYAKAYYTATFTEGVIYTGTAVSLDSDGETVLSGGVGTVYDDPNVTNFTRPTNSKLGTVLDNNVTIGADSTPYTGGKAEPHPEVTVSKTALSKTLVEGEDYTVETTAAKNTVGTDNSFTVKAIDGSGNVGSKGFDVDVTARELGWDVSDITVSKVADGKTDAAQVQGTLKLVGVVEGETVTLSYTSLTAEAFPDSKPGDYSVKLTVAGAALAGADKDNYTLPTADIVVTATITEAPAPTATATPAPAATPAPTAQPKAPNTGDEANVALWLVLATASVFGVAVVGRKKVR